MQPSVEQSYSAFRLEWLGTRDKLVKTRLVVDRLLSGTQSNSKAPVCLQCMGLGPAEHAWEQGYNTRGI